MGEPKQKYELFGLNELFLDGERSFRIPAYQRGYSWETRQRIDLQKDIEYIIQNGYGYKHFAGTVVASRNDTSSLENGFETYDIVDGQQRLTTLVIMLAVIGKKLQASKIDCQYDGKGILETYVASGQETGNTARRFFSSSEQDELFKKLVLDGADHGKTIKSKSDQNLVDAYTEFSGWISDDNICAVTKCILENLGFLLYAPQNDKEIGIMFEVINNRGKALSQLEKIKNYLIYYSDKNDLKDLKDQVHESWPHILNNLNKVKYTSNEDENAFLRNCWIVFGDTNKSKSYHVYDEVKLRWSPDSSEGWYNLTQFVLFLERASLTYTRMILQEEVGTSEKCWLERIHHHPRNASMTPMILAIYERINAKEHKEDLLELIEKLNFRFYATGIAGRSDSGQGEFFGWAYSLYNHYENEDQLGEVVDFHWLRDRLFNYIDKNASDKKLVQHLTLDIDEGGDYYHWSGLKFFLASYEEKLRNEKKESLRMEDYLSGRDSMFSNDFFHKEHIWADKEITVLDDTKDRNVNKRRLGNFILLKEGHNISASKERVEVKIYERYWKDQENEPNTLMIRRLRNLFEDAVKMEGSSKDWKRKTPRYWYNVYRRFLDRHEQNLVEFALERWKVAGLTNPVVKLTIDSFTDKNEVYHLTFPPKLVLESEEDKSDQD